MYKTFFHAFWGASIGFTLFLPWRRRRKNKVLHTMKLTSNFLKEIFLTNFDYMSCSREMKKISEKISWLWVMLNGVIRLRVANNVNKSRNVQARCHSTFEWNVKLWGGIWLLSNKVVNMNVKVATTKSKWKMWSTSWFLNE